MHPEEALFQSSGSLPDIAVCEHFAGTEKTMRKALQIQREMGPVFDITLDCEDGAVKGSERDHAIFIGDLISSDENAFGRVGVRIHNPGSEFWESDLEEVMSRGKEKIAYITIPKIRSVWQVESALEAIELMEGRYRIENKIPVHILIESREALLDIERIVRLRRIETVDFGLMDYISDHQGAIPVSAMKSPGQFEHNLIRHAREKLALTALCYGVIPSQNVTIELSDPQTARDDARVARKQFGFMRMWSIHPAQIQPVIEGMSPDKEEVDLAAAILTLAENEKWGPIRYNDTLHDRASYRSYWTILKRAHRSGLIADRAVLDRWFS